MSSRVLLVLIGALGAGVLLGQLFPVPPPSTLPRPASASAIGSDVIDFELTVHDGSTLYASDLREKALLVFFGYTHCPDICPTTLVEMASVKVRDPSAMLNRTMQLLTMQMHYLRLYGRTVRKPS